jgi:hypothetical protein
MADTTETASTAVKLTFATMTTMVVVGSMVGGWRVLAPGAVRAADRDRGSADRVDHRGTRRHATLPEKFVMARREQGRKLFSTAELVILVVSIVGAVLGVVALVAGWITI